MSHIQMIPLNRLVVSANNVRRTERKADLNSLAASIAAHGLLQNLAVSPTENDRFEVIAGARRHAALKSLAKSGAIARDFAVACKLVASDEASEASLAENVQRVAMNAMDEVEAFAALVEFGLTPDDVARRFGCTLRHVEQRLALANLSTKVKAAYRRGDVTLDAARAFCIEPDHSKQDAVLRGLAKPITSPGSVRTHLMSGAMKASDRLARFVGLEAYEAAGGALARDLFDSDTIFVSDPALMTRLAQEQLDAMCAPYLDAGWGWVKAELNADHRTQFGRRLYPTRRPLTKAEQKRADKLDAELEELEAALDEADEDDPRWDERNELEARRHALIDASTEWDRELIAHAGVAVSISYDGRAEIACGLVLKSDQTKIDRLITARTAQATHAGVADDSDETGPMPWDECGPRLAKSLVRDLTRERTRALRDRAAANADSGLSLVVYALISQAILGARAAGLELAGSFTAFDDHPALNARREALLSSVPGADDDLFAYCFSADRETLLELLSLLVSQALDFSNEGASPADHRTQANADRLASALELNMTTYWRADVDFWSKLARHDLVGLYQKSPAFEQASDSERSAQLKAVGKMKKYDLAVAVDTAMRDANWLPAPLVVTERYVLTPEGKAAISELN